MRQTEYNSVEPSKHFDCRVYAKLNGWSSLNHLFLIEVIWPQTRKDASLMKLAVAHFFVLADTTDTILVSIW